MHDGFVAARVWVHIGFDPSGKQNPILFFPTTPKVLPAEKNIACAYRFSVNSCTHVPVREPNY